ncbi:MAG TPA: protein-disulfide reductase DsbD domain-containing protein [Candidatus Bathyarchaeia archaeon]|nr:protein-disulfide reductase DsbD domain-containing protein [Candidatus Bathyarchaeia archaeon]
MATTRPITRFTFFMGVVVLLLCLSVFPSSGQAPKDTNLVHVEAYASHKRVNSGKSFHITIVANIKQGFHINSHKPLDEFLLPTLLRLNETRGIAFGSVCYPKPKQVLFSFSPNHLSVYDGKISIFAEGKVSKDISPGDIKVSGVFTYQACDDQMCFMPESVCFEVPLKIVKAD